MAGYAELHCHTNFSFLDGASHPEDLAVEAARLGLTALAVTDHDGLYGAVRFALAAREHTLPTVFGAEMTLGITRPAAGEPDPEGEHLLVLAEGPVGYARLARAISEAQMAGEKGAPRTTVDALAAAARAPVHLHPAPSARNDAWYVLTGCRKGTVPAALVRDGPAAARAALDRLVAGFGADRVLVELWDHGDPIDRHRNDALARVAMAAGVDVIATNNVHYATPAQRPLATALAAVRARRSLDEIDGWLPASPFAHLRSAAEQERRFARWPGAVARTVEIASACAFDLRLAAPELPDHEVPEGHTEMTWLRELTARGARIRYPSTHSHHEQAMHQIAHELDVIEQLNFPGYFLVLVDIVAFCRAHDIYCQGRGSAANSAVCYALGVTQADAVALGLLFERFLSLERDGPPDIDLDIEHQRREEVIQYVYDKYGRERAAQVANVITYRPRSALREMAKVVGLSPGHADALTKWIDRWSRDSSSFESLREGRGAPPVPKLALDLAEQVIDFPRHLGIHSGGMVMADRPLIECCPVEWARMEHRSVLQWDKDDCAAAGLVKFDLLGLGMLTMLHLAVDLVREHEGVEIELATIPQEPEVYALLSAADTIGVFQVESRAQMATLPRLRPECFYDLVVEVALDPPRTDPGWVGAPLSPAPQRRGTRHLPAPAARAVPREDARGAAVPGAAHADGDRRRRVHAGGVGPSAPGDGLQALPSPHGGDARTAPRRDGRARHHRRGGRRHRAQDRGLRRLRLPREPLGQLRLPRVLQLVDQAALPGRVRVRAAQRAADGVLLTAHHRARRDPPRGGGARPVRAGVAPRLHAGAADGRRGPDRPSAAGVARRPVDPRHAGGAALRARPERRARSTASTTPGTSSPSPTSPTSPAVPVRPPTRSRRWPPRVRSRASTAAGAPRCGRPVRCATRAPTSCRAW